MRKSIRKIVSAVLAATMAFTSCIAVNVTPAVAETADGNYEYVPTADAAAEAVVYDGDNATITAKQKMAFKTISSGDGDVFGSHTYKTYAQTSSVDTVISVDGATAAKLRVAYAVTAKNDCTIVVDHKVGSGKTNYVLKDYDATAGTATALVARENTGDSSIYLTDKFDLKAGETVYIAGKGTNICVYAIDVIGAAETTTEATTAAPTTEATTEATTAAPTTETTTAAPTTEATEATTAASVSGGYVYVPSAAAEAEDVVYSDDNATITAKQKMAFKTISSGDGDVFGSHTYKTYAQTSSVDTVISVDGATAAKLRVAYAVTAKNDCTIVVDHKVGSGKTNYVLKDYDATAGTATALVARENTGDSSIYLTDKFDLKAGETVYIAGKGTNICVYAIDVIGAASETTTEATTAAPTTAATTQATTAAPTTEATEATTQAPISSDKIAVSVDNAEVKVGKTVEVPVKVTNNKGFNNYTMFINFDPATVSIEDAADGDIVVNVGGVDYKASLASDIKAQLTNVPAVGNTDFPTADGVKTQAELGRVKVAFVIDAAAVEGTSLKSFTTDGTLFTLTVKGVAAGSSDLSAEVVNDEFSVVSSDSTVVGTYGVESTKGTVTVTEAAGDSDYVWIPSAAVSNGTVVYSGNGATITAQQDNKFNSAEDITITDSGKSYTGYTQTTGVDTALSIPGVADGAEKTYRIAYAITATEDCTIAVDNKVAEGKTNFILKNVNITGTNAAGKNAGTAEAVASIANDGDASIYKTFTVDLKAGETIYVAGQGTNIVVYAIDVKTQGGSEETTEGTTATPVSGFSFGNGKVSAAKSDSAQTVQLPVTLYNNPGFTAFSMFIEYDTTNLKLVSAASTDSAVADMINAQIAYAPSANDPDYTDVKADGTKTSAELGKVKIANAGEAYTANDAYITLTFEVAAGTPAGDYVVKTVGTEGADTGFYTASQAYAVTMLDNVITITKGSGEDTTATTTETTTETTTATTTETTTQTTTQATTTETTTTRRSSSGGGGGGSSHRATTTEATTEATTSKVTTPSTPKNNITVDEDGNITIVTPNGDVVKVKIPTDTVADVNFKDIDNYPWAKDAINTMASLGIISGTAEDMFSPALPCKRGDFAILINRTLGLETAVTKNFDDNTDSSKYYYDDLRIGYSAGILSGYGDNNYKPEQYCTREEMFVLVAKTLEYLGVDVTSTSQSVLDKYADVDDISWWSAPYAAFLTDVGIITGSNGNAEPDRYINRAEMAVMMYKDYEYTVNYLNELGLKAAAAAVAEEQTSEETTEATTVEETSTETTTSEESAEE